MNLITEKGWRIKNIRLGFVLFVLMTIAFFFSFATSSYAITITGTDTITTNSSASYSVGGCDGSVSWSVTGTGASISSNGVLTTGSASCGGITVTARCSDGSIATKTVRVTNAGAWYTIAECNHEMDWQNYCLHLCGSGRVSQQGFGTGNEVIIGNFRYSELTIEYCTEPDCDWSQPGCQDFPCHMGATCCPAYISPIWSGGKLCESTWFSCPPCGAGGGVWRTVGIITIRSKKEEWKCPPCTNGQTISCYTGPAETKNKGECKAGTQTCVNRQWGACQGEVLPSAEICGDSIDNNCDGQVDEGCCEDKDGDGHYAIDPSCPEGDDCNDGDSSIYPGATEKCDNKDNNCDGEVDEGLSTDADEDGHYTPDSCKTPNDDCNDSDAGIYPGAQELCYDCKDNNCNNQIDEGCCPEIESLTGSDAVIDPNAGGSIRFTGSIKPPCNKPVSWSLSLPGKTFNGSGTGTSVNVTWDGKDASGKVVEPGTYTATLTVTADGCADSESIPFTVKSTEDCKLLVDFASSANIASGNLYHSQTLFNIPNSKLLGDFTLSYNSLDSYSGPLGIGWTHTYNISLRQNNDGTYTVLEGDGRRVVLYQNGSYYTPETSSYPALIKNADGTYWLYHKDGISYIFNSIGKITSISDRNSNAITFSYDSNNNLTRITDPSGRNIYLSYDAFSRISAIIDLNGNNYNFTYSNSALSNISTTTSLGTLNWSYTYDADAFMLSKIDPQGYTTTYLYDEGHRIEQATNPEGNTKTITYNPETTTSQITESNGAIWTYKYDTALGVLTEKTDPEGNATRYSYDQNRNLTSTTEPDGSTTSYTYDSEGNMTSVTDPAGNTTAYTYNEYSQIMSITDSDGNVTRYTYDTNGNLTSTTDATGATTQYQYDSKGNMLSVTTANGQTTIFAYDGYSNLISVTDSTGATTTFTYDNAGNMISQTDPQGNTTRFEYNSLNQLIKITDPQGNVTIYAYDKNGNRTSQTDANGNTTYYEYNYKGQLIKVTDSLGNITTYTYGGTGCPSCGGGTDKLTALTDAGGNTTRYEYDLLGRLIKETDSEGKVIAYAYDSAGNLIFKTDSTGIIVNYTYDALKRLTSIQFPNSAENISYTYDSTGKVLSMTDSSGATSYAYDNSNRLTTEAKTVGGISFVTSYAYTSGGALTTITYPSGRVISYLYDSNGRVIKVTETKDGKTSDIITSVTYNTNGTVASVVYGNGILTEKGYDIRGALSSLNIGNLKQFSYTRDNVGNITAITDNLDPSKTKTYQYDALYRLTQATGPWGTLQYSYDPVGNRLTENSIAEVTNYSYTANKLMSSTGAKAFNFTYDNNGNTVSENQKTYIYNQNQRLIKVTDTRTGTDTAVLGEYLYNANGQRVKKVTSGKTTYFIYDQSGNLIEEADDQGQVNIDYIYLGSVPIARVDEWWEGMKLPEAPTGLNLIPGDKQLSVSWNESPTPVDGYKVHWGTESKNYTNSTDVGKTTSYAITGLTNGVSYYIAVKAYANIKETYYYHTDHLGTPILMTNSSGTIVWEGEFLPFGEPFSITGTVTNNLRFPGQYFDKGTGLNYNYYRDYNPVIGRYISEDPIGFAGGDVNLYSYVKNNPVNLKDPKGLTLPGYNYCGPGTKPGDPEPINDLDTCCRGHDNCYKRLGAAWNRRNVCGTPECDRILCNCIRNIGLDKPWVFLVYITFRCWQLY